MTSTKVQLYCPSSRTTVGNFVIAPYATNEQVIQGVRIALNIKHAALYTQDAKPVTDAHALQEDERVLVAASPTEQMLPDAPRGFIVYNGDEGDDMDYDVEGAGEAWQDLTDREKYEHIVSLNIMKPTGRNKMRITQSWDSTQAGLALLEATSPTAIEVAEAEAKIEQCWRMSFDHFLPSGIAPPRVKVDGKIWNEQVVLALSVLSNLTHGQAILARDILEEAVKMRIEEGEYTSRAVQTQDIHTAISMIYERAGAVPARVTKPKQGKSGGRERRKALKERKKKTTNSGGNEC